MHEELLSNMTHSCKHVLGHCAGGSVYFEDRSLKCSTRSLSRCEQILILEGCVHSIPLKFNLNFFISTEQLRIFLINFETLTKASNRNILAPLYLKSEISVHEEIVINFKRILFPNSLN